MGIEKEREKERPVFEKHSENEEGDAEQDNPSQRNLFAVSALHRHLVFSLPLDLGWSRSCGKGTSNLNRAEK